MRSRSQAAEEEKISRVMAHTRDIDNLLSH